MHIFLFGLIAAIATVTGILWLARRMMSGPTAIKSKGDRCLATTSGQHVLTRDLRSFKKHDVEGLTLSIRDCCAECGQEVGKARCANTEAAVDTLKAYLGFTQPQAYWLYTTFMMRGIPYSETYLRTQGKEWVEQYLTERMEAGKGLHETQI